MMIACWSVKGGSGATVTAACLSVVAARVVDRTTLLVDLGGDVPAVLGIDPADGAGVVDWLAAAKTTSASSRADAAATDPAARVVSADPSLDRFEERIDDRLSVLPRGSAPLTAAPGFAGELLAQRLQADGRLVVVDAGTRAPGAPPDVADRIIAAADRSLLVIRPCYLALRHAAKARHKADGVVVVDEPGRSLGLEDVAAVTGAPVVGRVRCEPQVARLVDAGLLASRVPKSVEHVMFDVLEG